MTNFSPLRYPGGKGKLAPYIEAILQMNGLEGAHYAEPFAGGSAVALSLLFLERVKEIHINDLDWSVYAFWKAITEHTEEFIEKINETEITLDTWYQQREIKKLSSNNILEVGFATFFLNRTNRSGILNGGMIGGLSQQGQWKIDCRFNKFDLINRIRRIGLFKTRINITNFDASVFLSEYIDSVQHDCLIYIDPPYYVKGACLYQNHFSHDDHIALSQKVKMINRHKWLVSYDHVEQIKHMYRDCEQEDFSIGYSARNHSKGAEVMIFCPKLKRPSTIYTSKKEYLSLQMASGF